MRVFTSANGTVTAVFGGLTDRTDAAVPRLPLRGSLGPVAGEGTRGVHGLDRGMLAVRAQPAGGHDSGKSGSARWREPEVDRPRSPVRRS